MYICLYALIFFYQTMVDNFPPFFHRKFSIDLLLPKIFHCTDIQWENFSLICHYIDTVENFPLN